MVGTEFIIIKAMLKEEDDLNVGRYVILPAKSENFLKLRYFVEESVDGIVVINSRMSVEIDSGTMIVSLFIENGKVLSWSRVLSSDDYVELGVLLDYCQYGEVCRYE